MFNFNSVKRFLILTSDSGYGHRSAANSVARALLQLHPEGAKVFIINPIESGSSPVFLRKTEHDYDRTVLKSPQWYRFTYEISDSRAASSLVEGTLVISLYRNLKRILAEIRPDAVLTTNELFNAPVGALRRYGKQIFPFFTVVTDLADVHAMWFNPNPDYFFVANESVKTQALANGIHSDRVIVSGIPVDIRFTQRGIDKEQLRRSLGIDPDLTTFLFVGSKRVNGIYENLKYLENLSSPVQAVVVAGGDDELYASIARRTWKILVHAERFVTNIPEWMAAADILVTKAGGLILSEAMAAGLPVILVGNLPGQESGNVRYILENKAGARVENRSEFLSVVERWLQNNHAYLTDVTENARKMGHPASSIEIADMLWHSGFQSRTLYSYRHLHDHMPSFQQKDRSA